MSAAQHPLPVQTPPQQPAVTPRPAPPVEPRSSRKWLILLIVAVLAGIAIWALSKRDAQPAPAVVAIRTVPVATGTLEHVVRVAGVTSARQFANITAPIMRGPDSNREMILIDLAKSGAMVKKGQMIAKIDGQSMQDHVDDLADTIETAEADIRKRRAEQMIEFESLQQTVRLAKSELDKARLDNSAAEVKTDVERQILKLNLDETEARYQQVQADIAQKQAAQRAEIRILELTRERHVRHRNRHLGDLARFTMHAPMDGLAVMSQIFRGGEFGQVQLGDRVSPGQGFMKVVNTNSMQVEGTINQTESGDIRVGQPARIRFDAFPGFELAGKVYSIGALATGGWRQNNYIRTIPIRIAIDGSDARLIPDLSASADVLVARVENKTLAPLSGVVKENGKPVAYVKKGENFERRELELGAVNNTHAVVLAGLQPGDQIRLN